MKKDLQEKLLKYTAAAGAVLAAPALQGQMYTDIADTTVDINNGFYDLDLNQDGTPDFKITQYVDTGASLNTNAVIISPYGTVDNKVVGISANGFNYPANMAEGDSISGSNDLEGIGSQFKTGYMAFEINGVSNYPNSNWVGQVNDGYLGLRITVADSVYFGWARLDIADSSSSFTVKDFAVQTTAGSGILAGHVFINVPEHILNSIEVYTSGERLYYNGDAKYPGDRIRLVSLAGQVVWESSIEDVENTWDVEGLPKGIYAVEVTLKTGEGFAKKVFIEQ